jgi:hypothetical protein
MVTSADLRIMLLLLEIDLRRLIPSPPGSSILFLEGVGP